MSEAAEILEMHAVLRRAFGGLSDPSGIERDELSFHGFEQEGSEAERALLSILAVISVLA